MPHAEIRSRTSNTVKPEKVDLCELISDRGKYDRKLIEVTGFVTRGFEDSFIFDPTCDSRTSIWIEIGGKGGTGLMYCCGSAPEKNRPKDLVFDGITVPLVMDEAYANFDKALAPRPYGAMVRATVLGRFFSGTKTKYPNGEEVWTGFGHMGSFSLLAIQQVLSEDTRDQTDLDRTASAPQPDMSSGKCSGYSSEMDEIFADVLDQQKKAETGARAWSLDDPKRVAAETLEKLLKPTKGTAIELTETQRSKGSIVYTWRHKTGVHMIVVHRPYWLSFYAKDPAKTAWVAAAVYSGCSE